MNPDANSEDISSKENRDEDSHQILESSDDIKEMPFLDHLEELRWRIIKSLSAVLCGAILCFAFSEYLVDILTLPAKTQGIKLITVRPIGMFLVRLNVSLVGGLMISLPLVLYHIWAFVAPGLLEKERRYVPWMVILTIFCFTVGASVSYLLILPIGLNFFAGLAPDYIAVSYNIDDYISFILRLILAFGAAFELPMLSLLLSKIGVVTPELMRKGRRYALIAIIIVAAIFTPPDVLSQLMMAVPLVLLYEISILVSRLAVPKETLDSEKE